MTEEGFFIGELSKRTGVAINTIRFYEHQGILDPPKRALSGYRMYHRQDAEKILFIKKAQRFGLTLSEIGTVIRNSKKGLRPCCHHVKQVLDRKHKELDATIEELQTMRRDVETLLKHWVPAKIARKKSYAVCPQFEGTDRKKRKLN